MLQHFGPNQTESTRLTDVKKALRSKFYTFSVAPEAKEILSSTNSSSDFLCKSFGFDCINRLSCTDHAATTYHLSVIVYMLMNIYINGYLNIFQV